MKITCIMTSAAFALVLSSSMASAWDQYPFNQYIQRSDTITLGGGNARDVNAATHVIDPWPRYVGNRRIPGNGERMSGAVERYRNVSKLPQAPRPIRPVFGEVIGVIGGSGGGGGGP